MKRLILTTFEYRAEFDGFRLNRGSYLGRKAANRRTLIKFMRDNARKYGAMPVGKIESLTILHSGESIWIAK